MAPIRSDVLAAWQEHHQALLCPPTRYTPRRLCAALITVAGLALFPVA